MKTKIIKIALLIFAIWMVFENYYLFSKDYLEIIFSKTLGEYSTIYSGNYSEKAFRNIKKDMAISEVEGLLGLPVLIINMYCNDQYVEYKLPEGKVSMETTIQKPCDNILPDHVVYYYTLQGDPRKDFLIRKIYFGLKQTVERIDASFYTD